MSTLSKSAVVQAFLVDHRKFMKLLRDVGLALNAGDLAQARALAATLDKVAGPHIAFEEAVLYPAVRGHDHTFVTGLYDEHQSIVRALDRLLNESELDATSRQEIADAFDQGVRHAEHCGTLVSQLSALSPDDQREALDELYQLRASDLKWTELKKGS